MNCPCLSNAINKYGKERFQYEILEKNIPQHYLNDREIYWINHFNTVSPNGYNLTCGGKQASPSEETKLKLSRKMKIYQNIPEVRQRNSVAQEIAHKRAEVKQRHRDASSRPETKKKRSDAMKGNTRGKANKGRKMSIESRRKMSANSKGIPPWNKGKRTGPQSAETRRKRSKSLKGRPRSEETRRKISEGHKRRKKP